MENSSNIDLLNTYSANLVLVIISINVLLFALKYHELSAPFQRLFYFLILNLVIEISARLFPYAGLNNLPLLHFYTLGEFILLSFFYKSLIVKPAFFQRYFWQIVAIGSVLIICNSLFVQSIYGFNTIAKSGVQICLIGYAVIFFYNLMEDSQYSKVKGIRLINSAVIIYYSGSLFIFMFSPISFGNEDLYVIFWVFNSLLYIGFHLLIFAGLWTTSYKVTR